jgi:hypothetical protein
MSFGLSAFIQWQFPCDIKRVSGDMGALVSWMGAPTTISRERSPPIFYGGSEMTMIGDRKRFFWTPGAVVLEMHGRPHLQRSAAPRADARIPPTRWHPCWAS